MQHPIVTLIVFVAVLSTDASHAWAVTIPTVPIGNPGNSVDTRYAYYPHPDLGSVAYTYSIGRTEVTNAQYAGFLNAVAANDPYGLYNTNMESNTWGGIVRTGSPGSFTYTVKTPALGQGPGGSDYSYENKPVVYVSAADAMRFANWLHNRQPTGAENSATTEDGAYTLNGAVSETALIAVARNVGARWWLPNENEWYKAAYHKNDGITGNYWEYATGTNDLPNHNPPSSDTGNSANISNPDSSDNFPLTDAGAYTLSRSPYGTFDQDGNVREWNETILFGCCRGDRGGTWSDYLPAGAQGWASGSQNVDVFDIGFRVAASYLPGDFNHDGTVDAADYVVWRRNPGGFYTQDDFNTWRASFGATLGAGGSSSSLNPAVPEPASLALALLAAAALLGFVSRSKSSTRKKGNQS